MRARPEKSGVRELSKVCPKCGTPLITYTTTGGKVVVRCQPCFNVWRRKLYRKRHPRTKPFGGKKPYRLVSNYYIRWLLSQDTRQPMSVWPQWLVDLKREQLRLKRLWLNRK